METANETTLTIDATAELLAECAKLMNAHGPDSTEVESFLEEHSENEEFRDLAEMSRALKRALSTDITPPEEDEL